MDDEEEKGEYYPGEMGEGEGAGEGAAEGGEEEGEAEPPPPPPPEQEKELLFLIEFLVERMTVIPENMKIENIDPCALQGPVRVVLTFLHFPPMLITETDLDPEKKTGGTEVEFNAGKSLVFALTEGQFEDPPEVFLLVEACRQMPHAFRFPFINIGKTKIQLSELFKQLFEKYDENPGKTVSKSIKDSYELMGEKGMTAGEVCIYIRLTCLGENIVTEFSKPEDIEGLGDMTLFKNKESKKVYECKEKNLPDDEQGKVLPGWGESLKECKKEEETVPESEPDPEDEDFEEIFAEINGSAFLVSVEKSERRKKTRVYHISEFCDCDIPLPQDLVAGMSDLSLNRETDSSVDYGTGSPVQAEKKVGLDSANQLQFKIPQTADLAQPGIENAIRYNVKTCTRGEEHGHVGRSTYKVITDNNPDGDPPVKLSENDVFVLRIIKRGKKEKTKDVIELELKTPKEKIVPPKWPPYMIDRGAGLEKGKKDKKKRKK